MANDVDTQEEEDQVVHSISRKNEDATASQSIMKKNSNSGSPTKKFSQARFENDLESCPYPLDIIVQKIHTVVSNLSSDSSDEEDHNTTKEINHALQLQGFKVVEKENGADCEIVTFDPISSSSSDRYDGLDADEDPMEPSSSKLQPQQMATDSLARRGEWRREKDETEDDEANGPKGKFKKGHRRAYSMPNAHRERAVLVVTDDQVRQEGPKKRHVVRYRLHPYKPTPKINAAVKTFIEATNFDDQFGLDENGDDFEIEMNEEHMTCLPGDEADTKQSRLVLKRFWEAKWKKQNFEFLPDWLQDNEFLHTGHRPPLASFGSCFKSIFSVHTESGNIWTHMYGCVAFIGMATWFLIQPSAVLAWRDKLVFSFFFLGAICCLGLSFAFHTVQCHSQGVGRLFSKLDYSGITMLIVGSFIPWMYYGFYCRSLPMAIYTSMILIFGIAALIVSLWEKFAQPTYRPLRAIVFMAMGLSGCIPALHLLLTDGLEWMIENASIHWLVLMAALYIIGAGVYAFRFPERYFPGKFDLFCQSHQLFHLFVIVAAYVHFYGITEMAMKRLEGGSCHEQMLARYGTDYSTNIVDDILQPYSAK